MFRNITANLGNLYRYYLVRNDAILASRLIPPAAVLKIRLDAIELGWAAGVIE